MGRRIGDRRDGTLIRDIDSMHFIMPMLYPNRCDNEAFISERIDLTNAAGYLAVKNAGEPEYPYNLFQLIVTAMLKTVALRPKMNRFIANGNMYQRNELTASFVVKKLFADDGGEALALIKAQDDYNIDSIHDEIFRQVSVCRSDKKDGSSESMDAIQRLPRFVAKAGVRFLRVLDKYGKVPAFLIATDPYYSSIVLTNLGSIQLRSGYHHLTNWGTNSIFCAIGERKRRPFYRADGSVEMRDSIDLGLTIDERLADGYYYSRTMRLLRRLLEEPELLERPLCEKVEF